MDAGEHIQILPMYPDTMPKEEQKTIPISFFLKAFNHEETTETPNVGHHTS